MADALAALPAGILAAMGIVVLIAGPLRKSDRLSVTACCAALLLAALTIACFGARPAADARFRSEVRAAVGPDIMLPPSLPARTILREDRLSWIAVWLALALAVPAALLAVEGKALAPGRSAQSKASAAWLRLGMLLLSLCGLLLAAVANDLAVAVFAMELASLPATLLLFVDRPDVNQREGGRLSLALNLFALGALVAGALLIGLWAGTTNLSELGTRLPFATAGRHSRTVEMASPFAAEIGCVLLVAGLGVHFLAAPFHLAAAELFDAARMWTIGLTALVPRGAALLLMVRLLVHGPPRLQGTAQTLFTAVGFLTLLIGALLIVSQTRTARLLAFTIVLQSGLILVGLAAGCAEAARPASSPWLDGRTPGGVGAACLCFALDAVAIIGLVALVSLSQRIGRPLDDVAALARAVKAGGLLEAAACILAAGLAGLPPFAGFWPRVDILRSLLSISEPARHGFLPHQNVGYVLVAMAAGGALVVMAVVGLMVVKRILFDGWEQSQVVVLQEDALGSQGDAWQKTAVLVGCLAAAAVVILGLCPAPASRLAARATVGEQSIAQKEGGNSFTGKIAPGPSHTARRRLGIAAP